MFKGSKTIIFISKGKLKAANVITRPPIKVKDLIVHEWTPETLSEVFGQVKNSLRAKRVRVVLAEDLSYVLSMKIPSGLKDSQERQAVAQKITEQIPEDLNNKEWDYKVLGRKAGEKEVIAFAPVKDAFRKISSALEKAGLVVEAIEPEIVAVKRHSDPIVGIALKKDIRGKDEEVLNLELKKNKDSLSEQLKGDIVSTPLGKRPILKFKPLLFIFLAFLLFGAIVFGAVYLGKSRARTTGAPIEPSPKETATPTPTAPPEISLSDYSVNILNGSGVAGEARRVRDFLKAQGFEDFALGDADSYTYTDTEARLKEQVPDGVYEEIIDALGDYEVVEGDSLTEDSEYDVVIIVGESEK